MINTYLLEAYIQICNWFNSVIFGKKDTLITHSEYFNFGDVYKNENENENENTKYYKNSTD
jgi:hypothetical protein